MHEFTGDFHAALPTHIRTYERACSEPESIYEAESGKNS